MRFSAENSVCAFISSFRRGDFFVIEVFCPPTTSAPASPPAPARTAGVSGVWCSAWLAAPTSFKRSELHVKYQHPASKTAHCLLCRHCASFQYSRSSIISNGLRTTPFKKISSLFVVPIAGEYALNIFLRLWTVPHNGAQPEPPITCAKSFQILSKTSIS